MSSLSINLLSIKYLRTACVVLVLASLIGGFALGPISVDTVAAQTVADALRPDSAAASEASPKFGCMSSSSGDMVLGCLAWASYMVMSLFAWIAGGAGVLLNFVVMELVVGMGQLVGELTAITDAWIVLRDIANVFLVFLTVFIGIATILGSSTYHYKTLLWRVVLAALFVNFSMLFTKVIIDVSNLASVELYGALLLAAGKPPDCTTKIETADYTGDCINDGIAGVFWNQMKVITLMQSAKGKDGEEHTADWQRQIIYIGALGSILFIVMTFVFGAAALLLVGRFLKLVYLIIMSPVAFVVWITGINGMGRTWFKTLLDQAIFAPAMFLMFWIAYKVSASLTARYVNGGDLSTSFTMVAGGEASAFSLLLYFVLICGFLIAALMVAKSLGAAGATTVMATGRSWARSVGYGAGAATGAATFGALAYGSRRTIGRAARAGADSETLKNFAAKNKFTRFIGTKTSSALSGVAGSSMDVRSAPVIGKTASTYLGSAQKGGYDAWKKGKVNETKEIDKWLSEHRGTAEQKRQRDQDMEDVNRAAERAKQIDVSKELVDTETTLKETIASLDKTIQQEKGRGLTPEKEAELTAQRNATQSRLDVVTNARKGMEEKREAEAMLADTGLTGPGRAIAQERLTRAQQAVDAGYRQVDPELERLHAEQQLMQDKLAQTQDANEKKALQQSIARAKEQYEAIAQYHTMRSDVQAGNPRADEREVLARLDQARIAQRQAIDNAHTKAWADEGKARSARFVDQLSTEDDFGTGMSDWKREAAAELRRKQKQSSQDKMWEQIKKVMKEEEEKPTTSTQGTSAGESSTPPTS